MTKIEAVRITDLPENIRLIQLAEECAELSQAALKLVRALDGDTPVSEIECRKNVIEEMADVNLCMMVLTTEPDRMAIEAVMRGKATRWKNRLLAKAKKQDAFTKWAQSVADDHRRKTMEEGFADEGE